MAPSSSMLDVASLESEASCMPTHHTRRVRTPPRTVRASHNFFCSLACSVVCMSYGCLIYRINPAAHHDLQTASPTWPRHALTRSLDRCLVGYDHLSRAAFSEVLSLPQHGGDCERRASAPCDAGVSTRPRPSTPKPSHRPTRRTYGGARPTQPPRILPAVTPPVGPRSRLQHALRCRPFACRASGRQLVFESGALPSSPPHHGATWGGFWDGEKVRRRRQPSNSGPICPISCAAACCSRPAVARSVLAGTTMRVAERSGGRGSTAHVPGVVAAAAAAAAAVVAAHRRPPERPRGGRMGPGVTDVVAAGAAVCRQRRREPPRRLPPGRARPGSHTRPRRHRLQPW